MPKGHPARTDDVSMMRKLYVWVGLGSLTLTLLCLGLLLYGSWTDPLGGLMLGHKFLAVVLLLTIMAAQLLAAFLLFWVPRFRPGTGPLLVGFAITFWASLAVLFSGLTGLVWEAATLRLLANDPVVAAIAAYEADNGTPPSSLDALVPAYLPANPEQLQNRPITYVYSLGESAVGANPGSRWLLRVEIFTAGGDTVQFVYQPSLPGSVPYGHWSRVASLTQAVVD